MHDWGAADMASGPEAAMWSGFMAAHLLLSME
jgi:hypothetical protein